MEFTISNVHISTITAGDTVEHNGKIMTVCQKDIKTDGFFGTLLFGDSYRIGQQPVKKVNILTPGYLNAGLLFSNQKGA